MLLCPACMVELKLAERQGVETDYCPQCRGVWLDRGELDKIMATRPSVHCSPKGGRGGCSSSTGTQGERSFDRAHYEEEQYARAARPPPQVLFGGAGPTSTKRQA